MSQPKIPLRDIFKNVPKDVAIHSLTAPNNVIYDTTDMQAPWPTDRIKVNQDQVEIRSISELEVMLSPGFLCGGIRQGRHNRYQEIAAQPGYKGPFGLSEGDSWQLYPFLLKDIVDHFIHAGKDSIAIWSTDCAGDTLMSMWQDRKKLHEYLNYLVYNYSPAHPSFMLLSGGGNDLLGDGRLSLMLNRYSKGATPDDLIKKDDARHAINGVMYHFNLILNELAGSFPKIKVFIHGYDYPVPMGDKWIGGPMKDKGITDPTLQRKVIRVFMDLYNAALSSTLSQHANATYVDVRNAVSDENDWHDEIHPKDNGFAAVAAIIRAAVMGEVVS